MNIENKKCKNLFVIWGAGYRGKKLFSLLTKNRICAFIESDLEKIGTTVQDVPIIDFDTYLENYTKYFIIISPANYKDIENKLIEKNIFQYFILGECPSEFQGYGVPNLEKMLNVKFDINASNVIIGSNLYSILLYEKLTNEGCKQIVCFPNEKRYMKTIYKMQELFNITIISSLKDFNKKSIYYITTRTKHNIGDELKEKICINTYEFSDIFPQYKNDEIIKFKNKYNDKRCFIVATGASLTMNDLKILDLNNEICFGLNKIFNVSNVKWKPDFYVAIDNKLCDDYSDEILKYNAKNKFISYNFKVEKCNLKESVFPVYVIANDIFEEPINFSEDISKKIYGGATVTYVAIQIAIYMGFKEIYLLGVDCNYVKGGKNNYFFKEEKADNINHNVKNMIKSYVSAKRYADIHGIKIYNATRGGMLEVFERVNFDDLF